MAEFDRRNFLSAVTGAVAWIWSQSFRFIEDCRRE